MKLLLLALPLLLTAEMYQTIGNTTFGPRGPGVGMGLGMSEALIMPVLMGRRGYGRNRGGGGRYLDHVMTTEFTSELVRRNNRRSRQASMEARALNAYKYEMARLKNQVADLQGKKSGLVITKTKIKRASMLTKAEELQLKEIYETYFNDKLNFPISRLRMLAVLENFNLCERTPEMIDAIEILSKQLRKALKD